LRVERRRLFGVSFPITLSAALDFSTLIALLFLGGGTLFFVGGILGLPRGRLLFLACATAATFWIVLSVLAPSTDEDVSKTGYVAGFGAIALGLALWWSFSVGLGWAYHSRRNERTR
jgi:hypothetical protein